MLLFYFILFTLCRANEIQNHYDSSVIWKACNNSFVSEDQGDCNSCAAVALANSLSIRSCIRDGRNVRFSAQRIWDCYGGSCDEGVVMENFLFTIMYGDKKNLVMDFYPKIKVMQLSNISTCVKNSKMKDERIDTISSHKEWWSALENVKVGERNPNETSKSVQSIQLEIIKNGPVIAILRLTAIEMLSFSDWVTDSDTRVFQMDASLVESESFDRLHAVTIIGWGVDNESGKFYWKILNSFGPTWGKEGIGNVPLGFGSLEHEWYAVYSSPVTCHGASSSDETSCVDEPAILNVTENQDDIIFISHIIPIYKTKGNALDDGGILGVTVLCMIFLSAFICSVNISENRYTSRLPTMAF